MILEPYNGTDATAAAARAVSMRLAGAIGTRGSAVLGVPGGRSVAELFAHLAGAPVAWDRVDLFPADERCVPLESEQSNYRLIREELREPVAQKGISEGPMVHAYHHDPEAPGASLDRFNERFHGRVPQGRFDVLVLGVGEDGHVASLFPEHAVLGSAESEYIAISDAPKPPADRVTITPALVRSARTVVLLLFGEAKRPALQLLTDQESTVAQCPARLGLEADEVLLFTDLT
jgi:6-phosphogluconolactonase